MNRFAALVLSFSVCAAVLFNAASANPYAVTSLGPVRGVSEKGVEVFKGIRYAKNPVGRLRFAPPVAEESFSDTYDASSFCPVPVQPGFMNFRNTKKGYEDCLCLNIYRPAGAKEGDALPVYVWIFGGAFVVGGSSLPYYDGTSFAKNGVILVTLNYRLNALGFYASNETLKRYGTTGNWGILDMIEALKWVQNHIEAFGGDRNNVTLGGQSAGAYSASALLLSEKARGLFSKVILHSGSILNYPIDGFDAKRNNEEAIKASRRFASFFSASDDELGLSLLRELDPVLIASQSGFEYDMVKNSQHILKPYFDGSVLPSDPLEALYLGNYPKVDVLLGYNTNEGTMFTNPKISDREFLQSLTALFDTAKGQEVYDYFAAVKGSPYKRASDFMGDMMFNLGMKLFADELSKHSNVYMYHFAYGPSDVDRTGGVSHGAELPYAFNNLRNAQSDENCAVADSMHDRFINFIKYGDPNRGVSLEGDDMGEDKSYFIRWPKYESSDPKVMRFDRYSRVESFELKDELEFLEPYFVAR